MDSALQIGTFLSSRRARLSPQDVGLSHYGTRRRVPGLRREELAQVAGISADYYTRLEQGRLDNVSAEVLDAVATALQLSDHERAHLHNLARPPRAAAEAAAGPLRPGLRTLLEAMDRIPAYIVGHRTDLLGWNDAYSALFANDLTTVPEHQRNWAHLVFFDPGLQALLADDQPRMAAQVASYLRLRTSHRPDDLELARIVATTRAASPQFAELWESHDVTDLAHGRYHLQHPVVGPLAVDYEFVLLSADPGVRALVTYTAEPGTQSRRKLDELIDRWRAASIP